MNLILASVNFLVFDVGIPGNMVDAPLHRCVNVANDSSVIDLLPARDGAKKRAEDQDSTCFVSQQSGSSLSFNIAGASAPAPHAEIALRSIQYYQRPKRDSFLTSLIVSGYLSVDLSVDACSLAPLIEARNGAAAGVAFTWPSSTDL